MAVACVVFIWDIRHLSGQRMIVPGSRGGMRCRKICELNWMSSLEIILPGFTRQKSVRLMGRVFGLSKKRGSVAIMLTGPMCVGISKRAASRVANGARFTEIVSCRQRIEFRWIERFARGLYRCQRSQ
jgi:hypothetical protein